MKVFATVVALLVTASAHAGETLTIESIQGSWTVVPPSRSFAEVISSWFSGQEPQALELEISGIEATLSRHSESLDEQVSAPAGVQNVKELFFAEFPRQNGGKYLLVLGGWSTGETRHKRLFGYLYLFNESYLFNGWPVTFSRDGT